MLAALAVPLLDVVAERCWAPCGRALPGNFGRVRGSFYCVGVRRHRPAPTV